jgi:signal transduction histidine kinase
MPHGGDLTISTLLARKNLEITIEDNGRGIPPEERERIFEPFFSTKAHGTGLGLAISYGIIAAHGGSLEVVGGRSQGACFRISLPAVEATHGK